MATILIVDDHPAFRFVIKTHALQIPGVAEVLEADNGQDAIDMVRRHAPDLVVLDLDIPRISGLDVVSRLQLIRPGIRVLVLSAGDPETFAPRAMRAGARGFVSKSLDLNGIGRHIESVLGGYTAFPARHHTGARTGTQTMTDEERLALLSDKELAILRMLARGLSNKTIGEVLFISNKTVSSHKVRIMKKVSVKTLVELVDFARRCRIA
ncbi:response regulator transcription factor [Paraburkholderia gardini]|uniref:Virulence factors putative positive transcription regulator BvgA n=1 Tax=Paraburkholderia gardini TaxID=2823469 RepID=A0ABN7QJJ7_9BURK|nr:response regulator transcription factor [Paraburkholderia gardini]CAG4898215.1 Virulence factors putative positive transcription regulator BvgA [Paraburkholderia gardini]CAG4898605.1 Virulence factors putative positive transcription regulator BvgA [Paraburkholderia gardini]